MVLEVVAVASVAGPVTDIDLPVETEADDLVVLAISNLLSPIVDARLVTPDPGLSYFFAGADLAPLTGISQDDGIFGGDAVHALAVIRGVIDVSAAAVLHETGDQAGGTPISPPVPSGGYSGAVAGWLTHTRGVTGPLDDDSDGNWTTLQTAAAFYAAQVMFWPTDHIQTIPVPVHESLGSLTDYRAAMVLGLNAAPLVTRQYPRDDSLGIGSAPRLYPPPKRNRKVGGYL